MQLVCDILRHIEICDVSYQREGGYNHHFVGLCLFQRSFPCITCRRSWAGRSIANLSPRNRRSVRQSGRACPESARPQRPATRAVQPAAPLPTAIVRATPAPRLQGQGEEALGTREQKGGPGEAPNTQRVTSKVRRSTLHKSTQATGFSL